MILTRLVQYDTGAMHTSLNVLLHSVSYADLRITMHVTMYMCVYCGNHVTNVHENKVQYTLG